MFVEQVIDSDVARQTRRELITRADLRRDPRIAADNWKSLPSFAYVAPETLALGAGRLALNIGILALWLAVLIGLCIPAARRLGRVAR